MRGRSQSNMIFLILCIFFILFIGCVTQSSSDNQKKNISPVQTIVLVSQTILQPNDTSNHPGCPQYKNETPRIHINPIGTQYEGDHFTISGTTNLEAGKEIAVEAVPNPNDLSPLVQSSYYYVPPTVKVIAGPCRNNQWSIDIDTSSYHKKYGQQNVFVYDPNNKNVTDSTTFIFNAGPRPNPNQSL